jgi:hypothetical protein
MKREYLINLWTRERRILKGGGGMALRALPIVSLAADALAYI